MMRFPSCFGESGVQVADSSSPAAARAAQNLVTCVYQAELRHCNCLITVTWSKNLMGQALSVGVDDSCNQCICKVDVKPWWFSKRGSKSFEADDCKVSIFWDLYSAKFGSGPEPLEGFFVAVTFDLEMVLLLGDLAKEAYRKSNAKPSPLNAVFVAKKEHIFGKKVYCTKAQFCNSGQVHDIAIECQIAGLGKDPCLEICIDKKKVMQVKRLWWKFRGNQTILVDGVSVQVFWDVHNWLFGPPAGNAVFMFHTFSEKATMQSCSQMLKESQYWGCFSLILHAWRNE